MKNEISKRIKEATSLKEIEFEVISFFQLMKENGVSRLGYVSGVLTSEGEEYVKRNTEILARHTEELRTKYDFPVFSLVDIFDKEVFERINSHTIPYQGWLDFWREVLRSGHITDVFMTPRWEISVGARDEYETAKELGLNIIIL